MEFRKITKNKREFMPLLLLADEQEDMIERYLDAGEMFVLYDPAPVGEIIFLPVEGGVEIKSLAVCPEMQKKGYGRALIEFAAARCRGCGTLYVGTGDSPLTIPFYRRCGFTEHHRVPNFFTDHYDHPIIEAGVLLRDMVYLARTL